jgi:hypothetical protein
VARQLGFDLGLFTHQYEYSLRVSLKIREHRRHGDVRAVVPAHAVHGHGYLHSIASTSASVVRVVRDKLCTLYARAA